MPNPTHVLHLALLPAFFLLATGIGSCDQDPGEGSPTPEDTWSPSPEDTPDSSPQPEVHQLELRVHELGWAETWLHYDDGTGWTEAPGVLMEEAASWRRFVLEGPGSSPLGLEWVLNDGAATWYPGGTESNYRLVDRDGWLYQGLLFTHDPLQDTPPANQLTVLTVNLHTYQETDALTKLAYVADVIATLQVDLVAFQECAQTRDAEVVAEQHGVPIRSDNMVRLLVQDLADRLGLDYDNWFWDWSHYGFDDYEEGVAVMARAELPLSSWGADYVSDSTSIYDPLNSRKVVWGTFQTPLGPIVLLSAHLSWGDEQNAQIDQTQALLETEIDTATAAAFVVGDFNAQAGEGGYAHMMADGTYVDSYVAANGDAPTDGFLDPTFEDGSRIDYVFRSLMPSEDLREATAQRVFFDLEGAGQGHPSMQRVSDHLGVLVRFEMNEVP